MSSNIEDPFASDLLQGANIDNVEKIWTALDFFFTPEVISVF